ncbi:MAG: hypothetical protein GYA36_10930 [Veillonellaceae bacterium]|nr:hypothetical protein [Veillonellaceae bacterium]
MTRQEYQQTLQQEKKILDEIIDNTTRQIRFIHGQHRSWNGLLRLLKARERLFQRLATLLIQQADRGHKSEDEISECLLADIRRARQKIRELQREAVAAALAERNNLAGKLGGIRVTQTIRNTYIGRWYQGLSRGFSRQA